MSSIRNNNWYDLNSTRKYPLDDAATGVSDAGAHLPHDLVVDAQVRFPRTLCERAALSSIAVGPALVSVTLVGVGPGFVPLGAVSVPRPVQPGRPYPITPMSPGVGGYVVFGEGIDQPYTGRFADPAQGLLLPKVCRAYRPPPVRTIAKQGSTVALSGIVLLKAGTDVELVAAERTVGGRTRTCLVVRLQSNTTQNLFDAYKGPCGGRPESNTCNRPAVEFVNTVGPDCNGNLVLAFAPPLRPAYFPGGVALDYPYGLIDACTRDDQLPAADGTLPNDYPDECNPTSTGDPDANARPPLPPLPPPPPVPPPPVASSSSSASSSSGDPLSSLD